MSVKRGTRIALLQPTASRAVRDAPSAVLERPDAARSRELDGLRSIAVLLVVLFHLRIGAFRAGFLGVDIFFVISGFLITTLLLVEHARRGSIGLAAFWSRRAKRLLPALLAMLLVVAVVERSIMTMSERVALRGDLLATVLYVANWHLIHTSSYFASTGVVSPVEHTWSLAIEEQFYLLWPLVVVGVLALGRRSWVGMVAGLCALMSIWMLAQRWSAGGVERAYMGTDARVFEPLIGAAAAVLVVSPGGRRFVERHGGWMGVLAQPASSCPWP